MEASPSATETSPDERIRELQARVRTLEASERQLYAVLDALPVRVFWKDTQSRFIGGNRMFAHDLGLDTVQALIGKSEHEVTGPEQAAAFTADDQAVMTSGTPIINREEMQKTPTGEVRWAQMSRVAMRDMNGSVIGVIGAFIDITTRKQAEDALRESERRLRTVLDNAPIVLFSLDKNGVFILSEGKGLASLGLKPGEAVGRNVFEMYGAFPEVVAMLRRVLDGESMSVTTPVGDAVYQNEYISLRDADGNPDGLLSLSVDISALAKLEREQARLVEDLRQTVQKLEAANRIAQENARLKSEFLATMSHELRTPLNAVEGFTSIILNRMGGAQFNDKTERYITKVQANSKRLLALINDFLDISRIESGRMQLARLPFNPVHLANKWQADVGILAEQKQLALEIDIEPTLPATLYGDEEAISKVVLNLINNAIKFTEKGSVKLALRYSGEVWSVSVSDTGIGIPPHAREYIFDEFRQVDQTSRRQYGGTGLGLAIVQKLTRAMNGTVTVESEVGKGSTFTIMLPAQTSLTAEVVN
jgi:PAS domain S-box-containing protein